MGGTINKANYDDDVSIPMDMKLRCVVIFVRHGARTPLTNIKAFDDVCYDPNYIFSVNTSPSEINIPVQVVGLDGGHVSRRPNLSSNPGFRFPGGKTAGELTTSGRRQSLQFGRSLAVKYMTRLGMKKDRFVPHEVYVRAKNLRRTVDTARCVLAGMYPYTAFHGTVLSIHMATTPETDILKPDDKCVKSAEALTSKVLESSPGYVELIQKIQHETGNTGTPLEMLNNFKQIHDYVSTVRETELREPEWCRKLEPDIQKVAVAWIQMIYNVKPEMGSRSLVRLASPLLSEVERCLRSSLEDPNSPKLFLYACSDDTLFPMLFALSCFDEKWPGFLSDLIFELYLDQRSMFWVRVVYRGKVMAVGGLGRTLISYPQFLHVLEPYISRTGGYVTKYYHTRG